MPSVAYLGPEGTFSHLLARQRFKNDSLISCSTVEAIFDQVKNAPDALGLVPVENSSGGTVYDSVDLLIRHAGQVHVREELALDVRIALLGRDRKAFTTVYSHFVQLKHHFDWLKKNFPRARLMPVVSTAVAAQKAAASRHAAALASPGAADVYGLKVIEVPEVGQQVNVTHFYTIGARPVPVPKSRRTKTALIATLPNTCGSLYQFLGPFARQEVSLTRIVSRPVPGQPQTYVFFVEIEGGPADPKVARALERAGKLTESLTSLGTFPIRGRYKS
ncbi:hypothetical protein BH09VER1_BH09VER1_19510 [soil metagenome]